MSEPGIKHDSGKLRWDLLPKGIVDVLLVLQWGAMKYADDNWLKVPNARARYFTAACRHLWSWWCGDELDEETLLPHLAHAACCVLFLCTMYRPERLGKAEDLAAELPERFATRLVDRR